MLLLAIAFVAGLMVEYASAKDVYYDWHITWVNAAPDGFERPVIGINDKWPCPQIDINVGDRLIIDVHNDLGNQTTGIHWHGLYQYMTGYMDGTVGVTQCPIPPGKKMRYEVEVNQTGTYWYHSHKMGQYPDGLRGAIIVHDPNAPFEYDDEFTILLSDWYHEQMVPLVEQYLSENSDPATGGLEPLPNSALVNDAINSTIKVEPDKTYLVHLLAVGNWPGFAFLFDQHNMTVVEVDGVYVDPYPVGDKNLRIATGQRTSVLIHTKNDTSQNYAFWTIMDLNMMFVYENRTIPQGYNPNATAWLVYDETKPLPPAPIIYEFDFVDDLDFVPADHEPLLEPVDHQIIMDLNSAEVDGGLVRFVINNQTYIQQDTPSLYTALELKSQSESDLSAYGEVNPYVVNYGDVVEIIVNDYHSNLHPFHLHGHDFQCLQRTAPDGGYFDGLWANISATPMKRDTLMVQNHGHFVIRYRATNPDKSFPLYRSRVVNSIC
ncbi:Multicopper oxidase abr1 [Paecilomyces lecythidis]